MANYIDNLPFDIQEIIYKKKHQMEMNWFITKEYIKQNREDVKIEDEIYKYQQMIKGIQDIVLNFELVSGYYQKIRELKNRLRELEN